MIAVGKHYEVQTLLLALGANIAGRWGRPEATFVRACQELERAGIKIVRASNLYRTKPSGGAPQPPYLNAVLQAEAHFAPATLLRLLKQLERRAGRVHTQTMAPRALDIDILDYGGRRVGWPPGSREPGRLILPHPQLHARSFVLVPLLDVAPAWRHPVLGVAARTLLSRLPAVNRAGVGQALDFPFRTGDKQPS
jgi:2-amino-4-hydroxy-6-hydroxymethyldihydropteridine diphosphokinase